MEIRKVKREDLKEITNLFIKEYAKKPYLEEWNFNQAMKRILDYFEGGAEIFIALENRTTVGFIVFTKNVWWFGERRFIEEVVVDSEFQNKGIGKKLMSIVESDFKGEGKSQIYLLSHTNSSAYEFYKKLGFKPTNWVLMEK